jgi:hypothetical protein
MTNDEFRRQPRRHRLIADYYARVASLPVLSQAKPGDIYRPPAACAGRGRAF